MTSVSKSSIMGGMEGAASGAVVSGRVEGAAFAGVGRLEEEVEEDGVLAVREKRETG